MPHYDSTIIRKFADKLYSRANGVILSYTVLGALLGLALGAGLTASGRGSDSWSIIGGVILGLAGFALGSEKAFALKLQAQMALCQAQIEENTRARVATGGPFPSSLGSSASRPAV